MFVLTRGVDEKILIGLPGELRVVNAAGEIVPLDPIELTVTSMMCRQRKVKLGFVCDPAVTIHRQEVYDRVIAEATA